MDKICPPHTVFATNTSCLLVSEIAAATGRREKVLGMHFFNPVPAMKLLEIVRPGERMVFLDDYGEDWDACWAVWYTQPSWWNPIPMRHHKGTTLAFAEGHCESWGWRDQRTIDYGNEPWAISEAGTGINKNQPGNIDLMKLQKAAWGSLGYVP